MLGLLTLKLRSPLGVALLVLALAVVGSLAAVRVERVWSAAPELVLSGAWGAGDGQFGRATGIDGRTRGPQAFAVDADGNLLVVDSVNHRLQLFDRRGALVAVLPVPDGGWPGTSGGDRAAAYGLLQPALAWGTGFRPQPDIAGPAGTAGPDLGTGVSDIPASTGLRAPYITDVDLAGPAWRWKAGSPAELTSGPTVFLLAGWDSAVIATDARGELAWRSDLSAAEDQLEAGYLLDLDATPDGGVVVAGYALLQDHLVHFVRHLPGPDNDPVDLSIYSLTRHGQVEIDPSLPIQLEVESVAVGEDGRLYLVAGKTQGADEAPPAPAEPGAPTPFTRELAVFSLDGTSRGRFDLECESYTRYLGLVGVDREGLIYARLGAGDGGGSLAVFAGARRPVLTLPLPGGIEIADAVVGDRGLYVSSASDEGYQVTVYAVRRETRVVPRWIPAEEEAAPPG